MNQVKADKTGASHDENPPYEKHGLTASTFPLRLEPILIKT
jgi:hypothetical protein